MGQRCICPELARGFQNLEGAPLLAHPAMTARNERKESSVNSTISSRKASWIQLDDRRAKATGKLLLLLLVLGPPAVVQAQFNYTINGDGIGDCAFSACTHLTSAYSQGEAPSLGSDVFFWFLLAVGGTWDLATIYYLPGTTNWGSTFADRPTALWLPQVETSDASFGVRTNQFGFNINWASGMTVVVEACTNLASPSWLPLQTNTLSADSLYFSDPD
jgi:hypothetical protein